MIHTPTIDELQTIDQIVGRIRSRQLTLSQFRPNDELSDNQRRLKENFNHQLKCMIDYLMILVQDLDVIPQGAAAILHST
ncbi:GfV-B39-ORF1 [Ichnoviriform fumiferanae]|uniref:GfV-B39-ORF1 n=1 Tax=Ichnoviriform fumiferanae TaxID=419435 RepID=A2PZT6_9VIRU|nr:GfV-B39-ORF1 [Ichnoviriform fumiferanae]BAF45508.1 GfV-B39-ORF1 [Ichnoviriform fumiferanae]